MTQLPFHDLRVIDCATGLAGSVAAMMLGQMGAEVVKIEPRGGDPARGSAGFATWNQGKRSIGLDIAKDRAELSQLLTGADALVYEPGFPQGLLENAPHLITSCVRPVPEGFDCEHELPSDDFVVMAAVGLLDEQPATNRDGPAFIHLPFGSYCAAWLAAIGIAARLVSRQRGGMPGMVDTSILQGALVPSMMLWRVAQRPTDGLEGRIDKRVLPSIFECADGVWIHIMKNADHTPLMKRLLDEMGPKVVAAENAKWLAHFRYHNWGANARAFKSRPSAEWLADLWASDIPAQPALPMGELYCDAQAQANRYVMHVDDPDIGRVRLPGTPVTIEPPARAGVAVAKFNADRDDCLAGRQPLAFPMPTRPSDALPLEGIRIVDFGNYLAGPLSVMLLADLGADVVKVEPPGGDPMRANESAFLGCQRGKRSIELDLRDQRSRPVVRALIEQADIVHHNIRLPTAEKLGLGYEELRAINPRIVFGHVSAYGPVGDRRFWPGYDQLFQASTGWELAHAGSGNRPAWLRFGMMDHLCAASLAFGLLAALYRRERTGEGSEVAASLLGASILTMSEVAMRSDGDLTVRFGDLDSEQTGASPGRRLTRCSDGWIAFAGPDDTAPDRSVTAALPCEAVIECLRERGFAAVRVPQGAGRTFLTDPANEALGLVTRYNHPIYGELRHPGAFWNMGPVRVGSRRAPPMLDQHRGEILAELGIGDPRAGSVAPGTGFDARASA
ncbi:MAG: CoA transferase [Rhodobiaceae bacterium]|nr:CoA transferase [Novosphingobium sp.]MCC0057588.1 CoA transferase [Rhodobiaceae bacterium]